MKRIEEITKSSIAHKKSDDQNKIEKNRNSRFFKKNWNWFLFRARTKKIKKRKIKKIKIKKITNWKFQVRFQGFLDASPSTPSLFSNFWAKNYNFQILIFRVDFWVCFLSRFLVWFFEAIFESNFSSLIFKSIFRVDFSVIFMSDFSSHFSGRSFQVDFRVTFLKFNFSSQFFRILFFGSKTAIFEAKNRLWWWYL